jgi:uncharacterized protein
MPTVRRDLLGGFVAAALGTALGFAGPATAADLGEPEEQFLSLATSTVGGTWYPLGGAFASIIGQAYPQLRMNAEVTGGTVDNLKLLKNNQVELALSTNDQAFLAYNGIDEFEGDQIDNFKGLLGGHGIYWHLYTLERTGISSIADLAGKRISLGAPGSIGNTIGPIVFQAHGLSDDDWTPEYLGHSDGPGALLDGRVDAVLIISSFPTSAVTDITSTRGDEVVFINPEPDVLEQLLEEHPYWSATDIPGGIYRGVDEPIPGSFGSFTILVAHESMDDATAYAVTKALLENSEALIQTHALGAEWVRENATRGIKDVIPFHPGAEAYLKEQGLL